MIDQNIRIIDIRRVADTAVRIGCLAKWSAVYYDVRREKLLSDQLNAALTTGRETIRVV